MLHGGVPANRLAEAFADLWIRLSAGRSIHWRDSFRRHGVSWLNTLYVEATDRITGHVPSMADYLPHRRDSVGIEMYLDLCEVVRGTDLGRAVCLLPAFARLRQAACSTTSCPWKGHRERILASRRPLPAPSHRRHPAGGARPGQRPDHRLRELPVDLLADREVVLEVEGERVERRLGGEVHPPHPPARR
ncbi:terpene synthase family protein [Nonomuraea sp. JJY05]|uniref:terpene synthase family protein n=1 Tax=Nonomuraea sp. JJY05 TaxID=3350255 RepID=UPI00373F7D7C